MALALAVAGWRAAQPAPQPKWPEAWAASAGLTPGHRVWGEVSSITRRGPRSVRFAFKVSGHLRGRAGEWQTHSWPESVLVWVTWPMDPAEQMRWSLQPGDLLILNIRWRHTLPALPDGFDTWRWMQQQHYRAIGSVIHSPLAPPLRVGRRTALMQGWRQRVRDRIFQVVPIARQAGLVAALSLGDQNAIDKDDWEIFRRTGVAHLVRI